MKKLFTIVIVLLAIESYSQSNPQSYYKRVFDNKGFAKWNGNSTSSDQQEFSWGVPAHMEALSLMYEKTKDTMYANTLIRCIGNTIDRRDDLRDLLNPPQNGISQIFDYRNISGAAWSTRYYNKIKNQGGPYAHVVHSANITYPMAKFAAMVKDNPMLQGLTYPSSGRYSGQTYSVIAYDLIEKVKETLEYHEGQWHTGPGNIGYYKERDSVDAQGYISPIDYAGVISPFNMQSAVGRVFVQMYRATNDTVYLNKVRQLSNFIKLNTQLDPNRGSNVWPYWNFTVLKEDISHGGLTMSFPYECYKYGISQNGSLIYGVSDIEAYTNTLTKDIYRAPLQISGKLGQDIIWNIKESPTAGSAYDDYVSYMWLYLSKKDSPLYQMIADVQAAENYYTHVLTDSSLALALLASNENLIVPVNTEHRYGKDSDWRGVAKGNFDGGENDQFVVLRNFDGMMGTMKPDNKGFASVTNSRVCGGGIYNWKGLAAGDFFDDGKSEIIALSDHSDFNKNGFYIYKIENNQIVESTQFTGFGGDSKWVGVAAGNFISGGKDDFVAVRNNNNEVLVYKFNGAVPQLIHGNTLNLPVNSKIKAVAAGNLDQDTKDEIVLLVDADDHMQNGVYVYDVDDNGVLTLITKSIGFGSASDWKGLAVGNLDGEGVDEIIAHRNFDGDYKVFKSYGNYLSDPATEKFPAVQVEGNVMCFGNFNPGTQNEELVTLRKDGGIVMFSSTMVTESKNSRNNTDKKNTDPCQNELPAELFSFLKSESFHNRQLKGGILVKGGK
ncbi:VCBS repeat-containing protein [Chryseobacterium jejuense]|uniref:Uncharacterized protein n=1 Tax=Chryseobacterium jejuense TaxID=445960 RepID=A0A2X2X096_CHRJE|nr:VCBS repeat-containing protein [Chryseobacterium jejuense]SDJ52600.1 hypothetical protein SAMN05421542_3679 [Chryseobacterium jejuense]SQB46318.1 Uncharacterised protein [Chryseobacterium jejuense]